MQIQRMTKRHNQRTLFFKNEVVRGETMTKSISENGSVKSSYNSLDTFLADF